MKMQSKYHLAEYTHAATEEDRADLNAGVTTLQELGHTVIAARSRKSSVPNSYGPTHKVHAPVWQLDGPDLQLVDARLESRPRGARIPANYTVAGAVRTPDGFRCIRRTETETTFTK